MSQSAVSEIEVLKAGGQCTAGKDDTGMVGTLRVLLFAGVDKDDIIACPTLEGFCFLTESLSSPPLNWNRFPSLAIIDEIGADPSGTWFTRETTFCLVKHTPFDIRPNVAQAVVELEVIKILLKTILHLFRKLQNNS